MMVAPLTCIAALLLMTTPCWSNTHSLPAPGSVDQQQGGGEVRCFCNLPQCVGTGYMCKSQTAGCFSDLSTYHDVYQALHGCVDMLDRDKQVECVGKSGTDILRCCHRDMCNHVDSPEIRFMYNNSSLGSLNSSETTRLYLNNLLASNNNNEVWFKAATIAVPICGAVILLVLVGLALRILRKEHERLARHGAVLCPSPGSKHHHQVHHLERNVDVFSPKKAPLLFRHHNDVPQHSCHRFDKNAANAKLNLAEKRCGVRSADYSLLVPLHGDSNLRKADDVQGNLYHNVNLTFVVPARGGKFQDERHTTSWGNTASHV